MTIVFSIVLSLALSAQDSANQSHQVFHDQVEVAALKSGKQSVLKPGKPREGKNRTGSFFIALTILGLYGILRYFNPKYMENLFKVIARSNLGKLAKTDTLEREQLTSVVFTIIYFITTAYVVARIYCHFMDPGNCSPSWNILGISFLAVLLAHYGKVFLIGTLAWIFRFRNASKPFFQHLSYINQLIGVVMLPIAALFILCFPRLSTAIVWFATFFLVISLIYKYLANFSYFKNLSHVSFFHFFLYLCALEILPIAMIARWIGAI